MNKTITEKRPNISSPFRSEDPIYSENPRLIAFLDTCVKKGIIINQTTTVSPDGLTQTKVFETSSTKLLDALREFYFPENQIASQVWAKEKGHLISEEPAFNPDISEEELEKFVDFVTELER